MHRISGEIRIDGVPGDWAKLSQPTVQLARGASLPVYLTIEPPRAPEIRPGVYPLRIALVPHHDARHEVQRPFDVRLREYSGLSVAVDPQVTENGESFQLYVLNQGNSALRLALGVQQRDADLQITLAQPAVELSAGQRVRVVGKAVGKRHLVGGARQLPFALLAQAENASRFLVAIPATVVVRPYVSHRLLALALIALVAIALALGTRILQQPPPQITKLELSSREVASGTPVELRWQSSGARRFVIEVERNAVAELAGDATSFALNTENYAGPIEIAVIAGRGDETAIASQTVNVYQPAVIHRFEVSKRELRRHVNERIAIDWRATGAVKLDLQWPSQFEVMLDERQADGNGRMVLVGAPTTDFDLRLLAEDERGHLSERSLAIKVINPECTPLRDAPVFAGPDTLHSLLGRAILNVPVLVSGIDSSYSWLQVELASGEIGWGALGGFRCDGFEPSALRLIRDLPPVPTSTSSATPPPTATASATVAAERSSDGIAARRVN